MKIEHIETYMVPPRWIFVRVVTDSGPAGWGECVIPKRPRAVLGAIEDLAQNIQGSDPSRIEDLWQRMYRGAFFRGGPVLASAAAGIEQALWDIKGQMHGLPIYEFFGGPVRDRVRAYAWVGGDRPEQVVQMVAERLQQGFSAVKMNATEELHYIDTYDKVEALVQRVDSIRSQFGSQVDVAVDFHGRVHRPMAKCLFDALHPYHLMWIEEPLLPEHTDLIAELRRTGPTPVATGERLYSRWDFRPILESAGADILQPDVSFTGIGELEKISRMAEAYDLAVAPHCPNGPISLAATLQADAALPNVVIQELSFGIHYHRGYEGLPAVDLLSYLIDSAPLVTHSGYLDIPEGPGLGIRVDLKEVQRASKSAWRLPDIIWRNNDGTIAEW